MSRNTHRHKSGNSPVNKSRSSHLAVMIGVLSMALSVPALGQSVPFPTYTVGPQPDGSYVVSNGSIITPVGAQVDLGIRVRAKAVALNPTGNQTAAVLTMGTSTSNGNGAVEIFNTKTGAVLQSYSSVAGTDSSGSHVGITYTPDGKYLLFSQDSSFVAIAKVAADGTLSDLAHVSVPVNGSLHKIQGTAFDYQLNGINCFTKSATGTDGSYAHGCGHTVGTNASAYPLGLAVSPDGKTAYSVLDVNDTLIKIDLTASTPVEGAQLRVGNVPHSIVISSDRRTAYVSNKAGRLAQESDTRQYSDGTPVVADNQTGSTSTGTVSVVDLSSSAAA